MKNDTYTILKNLHSAGRISSFLALQQSLNREVLLYQISLFHSDQPRLLSTCELELRKWAALQHTNLKTVFDAWNEERKIVFVAEQPLGLDLETFLRRGTTPELDKTCQIMSAAADVLAYLHLNNIYQGGVSLSYFVFEEERWTRLTEKGLVRLLNEKIENAQIDLLASPDDKHNAMLLDISSWGAIFGALISGDLQFGYKPSFAQSRKEFDIDNINLKSKNPDLPDQIEKIILKSIASSMTPEQSYHSFNEILADLQNVPLPKNE